MRVAATDAAPPEASPPVPVDPGPDARGATLAFVPGDDIDKAIEDASAASERGDHPEVRRILEPFVTAGDAEATVALGTFLTMSGDAAVSDEGVRLLRTLGDAGNGHAAHNLATALMTPAPARERDQAGFKHYMAIATESGFEASVASDPDWWRPKDGEDA